MPFYARFSVPCGDVADWQDVPDVLGDRANRIRSLSVRIGPAKALRIGKVGSALCLSFFA